jgi:hypothetical protein
MGLYNAVPAFLAPPLGGLRRVGDGLEDAGGWRGDEDLDLYGVVVMSNLR